MHRGGRSLKPLIGLRYEFGRGTASLGAHSLHLRRRLPITRLLGVELCGSAQLPSPSAAFDFSEMHQTSASLDGPIALRVDQANLLINL